MPLIGLLQHKMMRSSCSLYDLLSKNFTILSGYNLHFSRFKVYAPHHMIFSTLSESIAFVLCTIDSLLADALTLAIDKEFYLIGIIIITPHVDGLTRQPVPMREEMQHIFLSPLTLIHIIAVFWKTRQIDNAKITATGRISIRSRFTDIIETGPDKLSAHKVVVLHHIPGFFMGTTP